MPWLEINVTTTASNKSHITICDSLSEIGRNLLSSDNRYKTTLRSCNINTFRIYWHSHTIPSIRDTRSECTRLSGPPPACSWARGRCSWWRSWCLGSGCTGGSTDSHSPASSTWRSGSRPQSSPWCRNRTARVRWLSSCKTGRTHTWEHYGEDKMISSLSYSPGLLMMDPEDWPQRLTFPLTLMTVCLSFPHLCLQFLENINSLDAS